MMQCAHISNTSSKGFGFQLESNNSVFTEGWKVKFCDGIFIEKFLFCLFVSFVFAFFFKKKMADMLVSGYIS